MATPIWAHVAQLLASTGLSSGNNITATVNLTGGFEIQVPIRIQFSNASGDPVVTVYRTTDGGTNFDTTGVTSFSVARVITGNRIGQASVTLTTGMYAIQVQNSAGNSCSVAILTQAVVTALS